MNVLLIIASFAAVSTYADSWNGANNPAIMGDNYQYNVNALPGSAQLSAEKMPWSETYWPSKKGSINIRWNTPKPEGFNTKSPTREQAKYMTHDQLAALAPSEKYDLYMGRYDYPLKKHVDGIATPSARWWSGVCHGWAPAALQFKEPQAIELKNPDGILIPFGSSDVKGLMSYGAAFFNELEPNQVGLKCNPAGWAFQSANCTDMNPGSLHVLLANQIGILKEGFVIQRDPRGQIWNQPVYGYKFEIVGSAKATDEKALRGVHVKAVLYYADELEQSLWEPVTGTPQFVEGKMEMDYILDIDYQNNITGGQWLNRTHPDFAWKPTKKIEYKGLLEGINQIYKPIQ